MTGEHDLEIRRVDVEAVRDDDVLLAIQEIQEAVFVEATEIARPKVEFALGVAPEQGLGFLGPVQITAHHAACAADDLASLSRFDVVALLVEHAKGGFGGLLDARE